MFSCRQNAFLLSPDSRQERTTCSICSSVCFMITVFHKAKHKLPSCKDVLARVLTNQINDCSIHSLPSGVTVGLGLPINIFRTLLVLKPEPPRLAIRRCRNRSTSSISFANDLCDLPDLSHVTKRDLKDKAFRLH